MGFSFTPTSIPDVIEVTPDVHGDDRGFFVEVFKRSEFAANGITVEWSQFNHSKSAKNVLRGLHYQLAPHSQAKLVTALSGEVFDVAVDSRTSSSHFGKWTGVTLSAKQHNAIFVPQGFAHGFAVLSDEAEILYYCDNEYDSEAERGIIWNDSDIGIEWPISDPALSEKDQEYPSFKEAEYNFE